MTNPIFDQLKAERGFDPLEGRTFPKYKASRDLEFGGWMVAKGQWVGYSFFVYQPHARLKTWKEATAYAELLNRMTD